MTRYGIESSPFCEHDLDAADRRLYVETSGIILPQIAACRDPSSVDFIGGVPSVPIATDDPQPYVGAFGVAPSAHLLDHLESVGRGAVTVLLNPEMRRAAYVEIG
jgi:hypothetical protein